MRILGYFILTLLLGFGSFWLHKHPGYVSFEGYGYEIKTSLSVLLILSAIVFFFARFLLKACLWIFHIPSNISDSWKSYQQQKDSKVFLNFLLNVLHHESSAALKDSEKIKQNHKDDPLYNYLYGQTLITQGDLIAAQLHFESMVLNPHLKFLGLAGLAEAKKTQNDLIGERSALEQVLSLEPKSAWTLKKLYKNLKNLHDYKMAKEILSRIEDLSFMEESLIKHEWADLYAKSAQNEHLSDQDKEKRLRQAHFLEPQNAYIAIDLAHQLQKMGKTRQGLDILSSTWNINPSQNLGDAYARFYQELSPIEIYQQIKKLTQSSSDQYQSILLMARYALKASLWGEARHDLMTLLEKSPSTEIYKLLSQIEIQENGDNEKAYEWLIKAEAM